MSGFCLKLRKGTAGTGLDTAPAPALSCREDHRVHHVASASAQLTAYDLGAKGYFHWLEQDDVIVVVSGDPVFDDGKRSGISGFCERLVELTSVWETSPFEHAQGTYCGVVFDRKRGSIIMFCDHLGIRPVYFSDQKDFFFVASTARYLRDDPDVVLTRDPLGASFEVFHNCFIDRHTEYKEVQLLRGGDVIKYDRGALHFLNHFHFWKGAEGRLDLEPMEVLGRQIHETFNTVVREMALGEEAAILLLSGGLDSRMIAAHMKLLGIEPETYTFGLPGTADVVLADIFASANDIQNTFHVMDGFAFASSGHLMGLMDRFVLSQKERDGTATRKVWTGDGGGVSMGYLYLRQSDTELRQQAGVDKAFEVFAERNNFNLKQRFLSRHIESEIARRYKDIVDENFRTEVEAGNPFFRYTIKSKIRAHMRLHMRDIDTWNYENVMPFLDRRLIELALRCDEGVALEHHLYMAAFRHLPDWVQSIPWKTYPGHETCPLPLPEKAINNTETGRPAADRRYARKRAGRLLAGLLTGRFPYRVADPKLALVGASLAFIGLFDYFHLAVPGYKFMQRWPLRTTRHR